MSAAKSLWRELGRLANKLDDVEKRVRRVWDPPPAEGRETPFWGRKAFVFDPFDTAPAESPLVQSAGRVTRVTRLTYSVQHTRNAGEPFFVAVKLPMRSTPRGLVGTLDYAFDFEWTFSIGSTERQYSTSLPRPDGWNWLSRKSLGNPEVGSNLLFNPMHPLTLRTNEFLTFRVRPTFWSRDPWSTGEQVIVNIAYAGYRTFGYGGKGGWR